MSRRNMVIAIAASCLILLIGYFMIPFFNRLFFNDDKQISEQKSITSELQQETDTFIQKLMFPVCDPLPASQPIAGSDAEALKADFKSYDSHPLSVLFEMYGLQYQDAVLDDLEVTEDSKYYLFKDAISNGAQEYNVSFAIKDNTVVSFYCVAVESPTSENIKEAVDQLHTVLASDLSVVQSFTQRIGQIYESTNQTQFVNTIYEQMPASDLSEIAPDITLWDCCKQGDWEIYSDSSRVILVSVMGKYNLQLFYDPVTQKFCGFNLATNSDLF